MAQFQHDFGHGVSCSVQVADSPPAPGPLPKKRIQWTGKPSRAHAQAFAEWMHSINQNLAGAWGREFDETYRLPGGSWETWRFDPGQPPKKIKAGGA